MAACVGVHPIATLNIIDVTIYVHIGVAFDVDVVVSSVTPAPMATAVIPIAVIGDNGTHGDAGGESNEWCDRIIDVTRRRSINGWRIGGHVNNLRV